MSLANIKKEKDRKTKLYNSKLLSYKIRIDDGDLDINNYDFDIFEDEKDKYISFVKRILKTKNKPRGFEI